MEVVEMMTVQTTLQGWQETCQELASLRQDFLVEGFSEADLPFLKKLCRGCNYRKFIVEKGLLFIPGH
jgi:hypothetical protein